jgi:hypothetical protein
MLVTHPKDLLDQSTNNRWPAIVLYHWTTYRIHSKIPLTAGQIYGLGGHFSHHELVCKSSLCYVRRWCGVPVDLWRSLRTTHSGRMRVGSVYPQRKVGRGQEPHSATHTTTALR